MTITICELKASANGSSRAVLQQNGQDLEWKAKVKTSMPWQPNSYDIDSNTLDFCFRQTAELIAFVSELESEIVAQVAKSSETYFGKPLAPDVVKAHPLSETQGPREPNFKYSQYLKLGCLGISKALSI